MKGSIALMVVGLFAAVGLSADKPLVWPQFRGPGGRASRTGRSRPWSSARVRT